MPIQILFLVAIIGFIAVFFVLFKRPIYEVMALAFIFIIIISDSYDIFFDALLYPATSHLFYAIFAFMIVAIIFEETKVVHSIIDMLLAVVGRFRGGAGYVALLSSTFMASLSGTGPGNVAVTGVFTIPMMKKSNFPRALAATTEMSASMLGNIIPPAGVILLAYGVYDELFANTVSISQWMVIAYGIGMWFFLQRWLTLYVLCRVYKVEPVQEELPSFKESFKKGRRALLLPLLIFLPLLIDAQFKDVILARIGEAGQEAFSNAVLMFTPALAASYALWIHRHHLEGGKLSLKSIYPLIKKSIKQVVPIGVTIYMAYAISQVFIHLDMEDAVKDWFMSFDLSLMTFILIVPIFFAVLGMVLPGSAQIAILGTSLLVVFDALGGNPLLFATLLPAMTGALEGMTPPLALGLFVAMGIAQSGFKETVKLASIWVITHLLLVMLLLLGILPILGIS